MTAHVFTYGSLMFPGVWRRVVHGDYRRVQGSLVGFSRHPVDGETYPGVRAQAGGRVEGVVYFDVDASDLRRLDVFEGDEYERKTVAVRVEGIVDPAVGDGLAAGMGGGPVRAEVYVYRDLARLRDGDWSQDRFEREGMTRFRERYLASPAQDGSAAGAAADPLDQ